MDAQEGVLLVVDVQVQAALAQIKVLTRRAAQGRRAGRRENEETSVRDWVGVLRTRGSGSRTYDVQRYRGPLIGCFCGVERAWQVSDDPGGVQGRRRAG